MLCRQLEYQSLKAVLQHMDANVRFQISLHMPSIRSVEKVVPLRIESLFLEDYVTEVNETSYKIGIIRHYPEGNAPEKVKKENRWGRHCDYDQFGFPDYSGDKVLLSGDISFKVWFETTFDTEEDERTLRENLRVREKAQEILTELKSKGMSVDDHIKSLESIPDDDFSEERNRIIDALEYDFEDIPYRIEEDKLNLVPFDCRRNNTKPPFKYYVQLTITKGGSKQIQRFEYTKKLYEAAKYLNEVLFGSRTMPIQIAQLDCNSCSFAICRLPIGFRMQVHTVHDDVHMVTHNNFPLLVGNSDSLHTLWINCNSRYIPFQSQIMQSAKRLVIADVTRHELQSLLIDISDLSNLEIGIVSQKQSVSAEMHVQLIQGWLSRDRPVGAVCWIEMENKKTIKEVLRLVRTEYINTEQTKRSVIIRTDKFAKVEIFQDMFVREEPGLEDIRGSVLKIRIVKA